MRNFEIRAWASCAWMAALFAGGCDGQLNVGDLARDGGSSSMATVGSSSGAVVGSPGGSSTASADSPSGSGSSGAVPSGSSTTAFSSGSSSSSPANAVYGEPSFSVAYVVLDTTLTPSEDGYESVLPGGGLGSFAVILSSVDVSAPLCAADAGALLDTAAGQRFVILQVKSPSYAGTSPPPDGGVVTPIQPGTFAVGFEALPDDDLRMDSALALFDLRDFPSSAGGGAVTVGSAMSGSISLSAVSATRVTGAFDVALASYSSAGFDTTTPTHLVGTFDVGPCPGSAVR